MCVAPHQSPNDSVSQQDLSPGSLQFITVGTGGTVSDLKIVRSHVKKLQHQKRRETKKAILEKGVHRKLVPLRQNQATSSPTDSTDTSPALSPQSIIQYTANLVPYAWFEENGPVLHVDRSKWRFPAAFQVTSSDRRDSSSILTPRQSHWMPYTRSPDRTMVKGAVLDAVVLKWIAQGSETWKFRVETINWIRKRLAEPVNATSNATIGAIMTFTQWTAGQKNLDEIRSHMDAVERIVNLRGGFPALQDDPPMIAKLTLFDSMIAVLTGEASRFPLVQYFVDRPTQFRTRCHESPLSSSEDFIRSIKYSNDEKEIISCLQRAWNLTRSFEMQDRNSTEYTPEPQSPAILFKEEARHSYKTPLLTLPLISSCNDPCHNHVLETLQIATCIYSLTLNNPSIDFPSSANEAAFKELCTTFGKCTDDDFWILYPGILLWVVLVGTAAARGKEEAAFWMFYFARVASFSNAENWLMESAVIRRFLRIQELIRDRVAARSTVTTSTDHG